ncbi:NAD+ synthase [Candidatus Tisiphia endosymbiont of Nemotelus uliginosus]|uniref:NAD+ synthase n=1 Tax=Candidatus Tisiphia endosymbiont of Nemotelus uliginosus TaxID=3077926 RepID=UPI0035C8B62E
MKILIAQLKPKIGNLEYNIKLITKYYNIALSQNLDVVLLPELITTGYLCEDLFLHPAFIDDLQTYVTNLIKITGKTVLLLPTLIYKDARLHNGVLALQHATCIGTTTKKCLPNYGVFDEKRYFAEGKPEIIEINGIKVGIVICEDFWFPEGAKELKAKGAKIILVPNASPYEKDKLNIRIQKAEQCFKDNNLPIIYCNQIGGYDGLIFDGNSFIYQDGVQHVLGSFIEDSCIVNVNFPLDLAPTIKLSSLEDSSHTKPKIIPKTAWSSSLSEAEQVYSAIILGFREYVINNGFNSVLLGISGGIDSALVSVITADSLGASQVTLVMLPSEFTSKESIEDAEQIAKNLKTGYQSISIIDMLKSAHDTIGDISPIAYENLQARIRGMVLMTLANSTNSLLIATSNKSESATGYATLYGDMCGGFNPIKDLYKTELYKIARFRNKNIPTLIDIKNRMIDMIPLRIFTKPPSAELAYNQKDSDSLPGYELLDQILNLHIEQNLGVNEIVKLGFDRNIVQKIVLLVKNSEFKRRQSAIGIKLSSCSFEKERRYPVTNDYGKAPLGCIDKIFIA